MRSWSSSFPSHTNVWSLVSTVGSTYLLYGFSRIISDDVRREPRMNESAAAIAVMAIVAMLQCFVGLLWLLWFPAVGRWSVHGCSCAIQNYLE